MQDKFRFAGDTANGGYFAERKLGKGIFLCLKI